MENFYQNNKTKINCAVGASLFLSLYNGYVSNAVNILVLCYLSYDTLKSIESNEDKKGVLTKWTCYTCFRVGETVGDIVFYYPPLSLIYQPTKILLLYWVIKNNKYEYIFTNVIKPTFDKHRVTIDNNLNKLMNFSNQVTEEKKVEYSNYNPYKYYLMAYDYYDHYYGTGKKEE